MQRSSIFTVVKWIRTYVHVPTPIHNLPSLIPHFFTASRVRTQCGQLVENGHLKLHILTCGWTKEDEVHGSELQLLPVGATDDPQLVLEDGVSVHCHSETSRGAREEEREHTRMNEGGRHTISNTPPSPFPTKCIHNYKTSEGCTWSIAQWTNSY